MMLFIGKSRILNSFLALLSEFMGREKERHYGSKYVMIHNNQVCIIDLNEIKVIENIEVIASDSDLELYSVEIRMIDRKKDICLYFESHKEAEDFRKDIITHIKCLFFRMSSAERMKELEHFRKLVDDIESGRRADENI